MFFVWQASSDLLKMFQGISTDDPTDGNSGWPCSTLLYNIWVNYNDLTATSLGIMVNKGNHPQMALIQVSEIL